MFLPDGRQWGVEPGKTLAEALDQLGWQVWQPCGGHGLCGRCRVEVKGQLEPPTTAEITLLAPDEMRQGVRLACQARIAGEVKLGQVSAPEKPHILAQAGPPPEARPGDEPVVVRRPVPEGPEGGSLLEELQTGGERHHLEPELSLLQELGARPPDDRRGGWLVWGRMRLLDLGKPFSGAPLGLALDLGTTTLLGYLLELESGRRLGAAALRNPQGAWGADVISRIARASEPGGLKQLQDLLQGGVSRLVRRLLTHCGADETEVLWVMAVANTAMMHLWLGVNPRRLGQAPYTPVWRDSLQLRAVEAGLRLHPRARVEVMPALAGFVGSDALSAALAVDLGRRGERALLVDLGTNGEMLLAAEGKLLAASTAVGPAFEGGGISAGMPAVAGAVEGADLDGQGFSLHVIGGGEPQGICGSGLVDLLALARQRGWLEASGRLVPQASDSKQAALAPGKRGWDLLLLPDGSLRLTQDDVRRLQLAKAALAAGVQTLVARAGMAPQELDRVLVAGAFGNHLDLQHAFALGLLPTVDQDKVEFVGNAAGLGGQQALLNAGWLEKARQTAARVEHVELAPSPGFGRAFTDHMGFAPW